MASLLAVDVMALVVIFCPYLPAETRKRDNPHALCLPKSSALLRVEAFPATHAAGIALILKTAEIFSKQRA